MKMNGIEEALKSGWVEVTEDDEILVKPNAPKEIWNLIATFKANKRKLREKKPMLLRSVLKRGYHLKSQTEEKNYE